ncbi:MAG: dTDP-4-dehydrorhamnose 3,5-epimerase [Chloroflexota bacterium]
MPTIRESSHIPGVLLVELRPFADERGRFMETFRKEWFPHRNWSLIQANRSDSKAGVLRGLHYHHHQVDYWYVVNGRLRAGLVDLRRGSSTFRATQLIDVGADDHLGLYIPVGVAHGFLALTDVTLTYLVDNYYDGGRDEWGVAWDDPDIGLAWGIETPLVSPRDQGNPRLCDIPLDRLPAGFGQD